MLHGAGNSEREIDMRCHGFPGLADLGTMRFPAQLTDRTACTDASTEKIRQFMELCPFFFTVNAAAAGHNDLCFLNGIFFFRRRNDFLENCTQIFFRQCDRYFYNASLSGCIRFRQIKRAGTHRSHLRTVLRADNISHDIAAHSRTGPYDQTGLFIYGQLRHICRYTADDSRCNAGCQIPSIGSGSKQNGARFLFLEQGSQFFS